MSHSLHKGMASSPSPATTTPSAPAPTPDAKDGSVGSTDPVPDVPPITASGNTTVVTHPGLWGSLVGGTTTTTSITATPDTISAAVDATKKPVGAPPKPPSTASQLFGSLWWAMSVAIGAMSLYIIALKTGIKVPTWLLLALSFVPWVPFLSIVGMIFVIVFYGRPDPNMFAGQTLFTLFDPRNIPKPV